MKNKDIILLVQAGILELTTFCLTTAEAYAVFKLRKSIRAAFDGICSDEQELLAGVGIDDLNAFNSRLDALRQVVVPSYDESQEMDRISKALSEYVNQRAMLLNEDVALSPAPVSYESWRELQAENREKVKLMGYAEELLEGILWCPPQQ